MEVCTTGCLLGVFKLHPQSCRTVQPERHDRVISHFALGCGWIFVALLASSCLLQAKTTTTTQCNARTELRRH